MEFKKAKKLLADKMRERRKVLHLTQEELAKKTGVHRTYIGGLEQENRNPSLKNIVRIANVLEIEPGKFFESHPQ